jgi:hypothetical protein
VTAIVTNSFLRIECDRAHCASVIVHLSFAHDEDADDYTTQLILEKWPPMPKHNQQDPERWLCAECLAGAKSGRINVTWRRS